MKRILFLGTFLAVDGFLSGRRLPRPHHYVSQSCGSASTQVIPSLQPIPRSPVACFISEDDYAEFSSGAWKPGRPPLRRPIRSDSAQQPQMQSTNGDSSASKEKETRVTPLTAHEQAMQDATLLSSTNVTELVQSPFLLRALREMGIQQLTRVQQQSYTPICEGRSVSARSKTGSGKTMAFLLPILDQLLSGSSRFNGAKLARGDIKVLSPTVLETSVLILVPTRELGLQITEQIKSLLVHRPDAISVMNLAGGSTSLGVDRRNLAKLKEMPDIIVATPGRLQDLITERAGSSTTRVRGKKVSDILGVTKVVVLDEADRLLLEGFRKETTRILSVLPRAEKRQTLLFSATLPDKMSDVMSSVMPKEFVQVDCIEDGDQGGRISRSYLQIPSMERYTTSLIQIVQQEMASDRTPHKMLIFFPTARLVRFYADLFNVVLGIPVLEIHSRMSQSARNKARFTFTRAKESVMFTSDVSARGIDYPDVTLVIQFGAPFNTNLNTHRIGRTARAGRAGAALLITLPFETKSVSSYARKLGYMKKNTEYNLADDNNLVQLIPEAIRRNKGLRSNAEAACISFIAYYAEYGPKFLDAQNLRDAAAIFAAELGLEELPTLPERLVRSLETR